MRIQRPSSWDQSHSWPSGASHSSEASGTATDALVGRGGSRPPWAEALDRPPWAEALDWPPRAAAYLQRPARHSRQSSSFQTRGADSGAQETPSARAGAAATAAESGRNR